MIVYTPRMIMRPFRLADAEEYYQITRDQEIKKYTYADPINLEDSRDMIENDYSQRDFCSEFAFALESKETSEMIGALAASKNFRNELEMNVLVKKDQRRKGYMTEAIHAFVKELPKHSKLIFLIKSDNLASLSMVEKLENVKEFTEAYRKNDADFYKGWRVFKVFN